MIESQYNKDSGQITNENLELVLTIGIEQKYPVYLGQSLKNMLLANDKFDISPSTFKTFVLFLERCKGYEEDATRFLSLAHETEHI